MLVIQEITLIADKPLFNQNQLKFIRFSYNSVTSSSKQPAIIINSSKIKWTQNINFPIIYNKNIDFQVFDKHQFGYNPQQFNQLIKGKINIQRGQTFKNDIQIKLNNQQSIIGKMEIKFRINSIIPQKVQKIMPKNQKLHIKSIIAHLQTLSKKKVYISIKLGDVHKQTPIIKSYRGQVVFTQGMEIQKSNFDKSANIDIFLIQDRGNQVKSIANGILQLQGSIVQRKITLRNHQNHQIGTLFVNAKIISKIKLNKQSQSVQKIQFSTIDPSKLSRYQQKSQQKPLQASQPSRISSYRGKSMNLSRLTPSQSSHNLISSSRMSNSQYRIKKMTVVHQNNEIVFPKQQRFKLYQDKQSNFISYLNQRDSLVMKQKHSGKFYRGASIGYGDKTDFAHKGSPGIGKYKLPSIWDRY